MFEILIGTTYAIVIKAIIISSTRTMELLISVLYYHWLLYTQHKLLYLCIYY